MLCPSLCLVIPCFNESKVIPITSNLFKEKICELIKNGKISKKSKILFVDDGSSDSTWEIIKRLSKENDIFIGIRQSRNRGHQNAVVAGLMTAKEFFDITISIDCDGQDDINAVNDMVESYISGNEIVYGVRSSRKTDTFFKRFTAESFYKLLKIMGADIVFNHADYRLVSKRVLDEFENYKEVNLFLRGLFPLIGFKSSTVYYERNERIAGESHYPLKKMLGLAFDGITSLCIKPLRLIALFGLMLFLFSMLLFVIMLILKINKSSVHSWMTVTSVCGLFCSFQLMCSGVIGEYIGKIYLETKARPKYIICEKTYSDAELK